MGIFVILILLEYNDILIRYTQEELIEFGLGIAKGDYRQDYILKWILEHKNT